jgi:chromosome partitioning protein
LPLHRQKDIVANLTGASLPVFNRHLNERQAYKAMFVHRLALDELDPAAVNGLPEAIRNAQVIADELVALLIENQQVAA